MDEPVTLDAIQELISNQNTTFENLIASEVAKQEKWVLALVIGGMILAYLIEKIWSAWLNKNNAVSIANNQLALNQKKEAYHLKLAHYHEKQIEIIAHIYSAIMLSRDNLIITADSLRRCPTLKGDDLPQQYNGNLFELKDFFRRHEAYLPVESSLKISDAIEVLSATSASIHLYSLGITEFDNFDLESFEERLNKALPRTFPSS